MNIKTNISSTSPLLSVIAQIFLKMQSKDVKFTFTKHETKHEEREGIYISSVKQSLGELQEKELYLIVTTQITSGMLIATCKIYNKRPSPLSCKPYSILLNNINKYKIACGSYSYLRDYLRSDESFDPYHIVYSSQFEDMYIATLKSVVLSAIIEYGNSNNDIKLKSEVDHVPCPAEIYLKFKVDLTPFNIQGAFTFMNKRYLPLTSTKEIMGANIEYHNLKLLNDSKKESLKNLHKVMFQRIFKKELNPERNIVSLIEELDDNACKKFFTNFEILQIVFSLKNLPADKIPQSFKKVFIYFFCKDKKVVFRLLLKDKTLVKFKMDEQGIIDPKYITKDTRFFIFTQKID